MWLDNNGTFGHIKNKIMSDKYDNCESEKSSRGYVPDFGIEMVVTLKISMHTCQFKYKIVHMNAQAGRNNFSLFFFQ